jgi:2-oxoisovalerate dehydrogenase E1 component
MDTKTILDSVCNTGRLLLIQEDTLFGGVCSDISALVMEQAFQYLDAPVMRVGSLETPIPFAQNLEQGFLAKSRVEESLMKLMAY